MSVLLAVIFTALVIGFFWHEDHVRLVKKCDDTRKEALVSRRHWFDAMGPSAQVIKLRGRR